jgi:hypothetical protein
MQTVPITNKAVSLNPVHGDVYSIQHYVIKFVFQQCTRATYIPRRSDLLVERRFPG